MIRLFFALALLAAPVAHAVDNLAECKYDCLQSKNDCREACSKHGQQVLSKCYSVCDTVERECIHECISPGEGYQDETDHDHH